MLAKNWFDGIAKKATFTIETPLDRRPALRPHYTFEIRVSKYRSTGASVYMLTGPDNYVSYSWVGNLDRATGTLSGNTLIAGIWNEVVPALFAGKGNALENAGWGVMHAGHCCHCGRKLTVPASLATGVGPECEHYLKLGVHSLAEVPYLADRQIAILQHSYWCQALPATLAALHDAGLEAGFSEEKADALVTLTKRCLRKFKDGKCLPPKFTAFIRGAA